MSQSSNTSSHTNGTINDTVNSLQFAASHTIMSELTVMSGRLLMCLHSSFSFLLLINTLCESKFVLSDMNIYIYMIFGPIGFNYTTRGSMIDGGNEDKDGRKKLRLLDQVLMCFNGNDSVAEGKSS